MIDKRLVLALPVFALLVACGKETVDEGAATGEVLEGTISDAMLPLDRLRSEAPLEDPEAFVEAQGEAIDEGEAVAPSDEADGEGVDPGAVEIDQPPAAELTPEPGD